MNSNHALRVVQAILELTTSEAVLSRACSDARDSAIWTGEPGFPPPADEPRTLEIYPITDQTGERVLRLRLGPWAFLIRCKRVDRIDRSVSEILDPRD